MEKKICPECEKEYEPDFPTRQAVIENQGTAIQREQHQTGICSDACWDSFLGLS